MSQRPWRHAWLIVLVAGACATAARGTMPVAAPTPASRTSGAPGPGPTGWWRMDDGQTARGGRMIGTWMLLRPTGDVQVDVGSRLRGAYRVRGDRVEMLDSAGHARQELDVRVRDGALTLVSPDGPLRMQRIQALGVRNDAAPVGIWHARPVPEGPPMRFQFTEGGCYRVVAMMPPKRGRWTAAGDTVRIAMREAGVRPMLGVVRDGALVLLGEHAPARFVPARDDVADLPPDARCAQPES